MILCCRPQAHPLRHADLAHPEPVVISKSNVRSHHPRRKSVRFIVSQIWRIALANVLLLVAGVVAAGAETALSASWPERPVRVPKWLKLWLVLRHGFF